jgi:hypothetical protein
MKVIKFDIFKHFYFLLPVLGLCNFLLFGNISAATSLANYDAGWLVNSVDKRLEHSESGVWTTLSGSHGVQEISIDPSAGVRSAAAKIDVTSYGKNGLFKIYFAYDRNRYTTLAAPDSHNRMILYVTIPSAGAGREHTFHIGTYSKNPLTAGSTSQIGYHWYHYYKLRGNSKNYWTKMYMDKHPQHAVGSKIAPDNNPTSGFDYFDGLTRLYLQMKYSPFKSNWPGPYTMYVDEIEFYTESRPENEYSINSVAITYFGNGEFDIDWSSFSLYDIHKETFEVKYSYSPINTTDDYSRAQLVPGSPTSGWGQENIGRYDNYYRVNFQIPNMDESKIIYFAIKDLYPGNTKDLKRVDYKVSGSIPAIVNVPVVNNPVTITPLPPSGFTAISGQ